MRFQIPSGVCEAAIAKRLTAEILSVAGVYAVRLYRGQQKLSIRYSESVLDFKALASRLYQLLAELERQGLFDPITPALSGRKRILNRLKHNRMTHWISEKYLAAKETAQAAKLIGRLSTSGPKALIKDPEKAVIDFLNDVLVLYLIKAHWTKITQEWLIRPIVYRYEWMAVFYLFFLLVRSRRKK
ncbi:MAG: hypothetical protein PHW13_01835 [Methylococcales bacterium]|nr:hypothetical protein [Methylococcales bacterium]